MTKPLHNLITLSRGTTSITLPVNPETLPRDYERDYRDVDIVNYRTVGRYGNRKLETIDIESFFPHEYDASYCNFGPAGLLTPVQYVSILVGWQVYDPPAPIFVSISGRNVENWFAITKFHTEDRAGEPYDMYYTLNLREFVFTNASVFNFGAPPRPPSPNAPGTGVFYTIVSGDTLWGIAKATYGDGSQWPTIWDANKPMTSGNPNLIFPGEVIFIPSI